MYSILFAALLAATSTPSTIEMTVTKRGFDPARVAVQKGEPVRLVVTRQTDQTCAKEIVIGEAGVREKLPLDKPVTIEFTPKKTGEIRYACGMEMVSGVLVVD
jgi:plastocyanin domain-containing protein